MPVCFAPVAFSPGHLRAVGWDDIGRMYVRRDRVQDCCVLTCHCPVRARQNPETVQPGKRRSTTSHPAPETPGEHKRHEPALTKTHNEECLTRCHSGAAVDTFLGPNTCDEIPGVGCRQPWCSLSISLALFIRGGGVVLTVHALWSSSSGFGVDLVTIPFFHHQHFPKPTRRFQVTTLENKNTHEQQQHNMSGRSDLEKAQIFCRDNPKSPLCNDVPGFYEYRVDLGPNAAFLGIFGASLAAFTLILVLGYLGRVLSWHNPWDENGFMIQICCLTIGPAFMAAGCYLCLRRIVSAFGPENSRLPPEYYTRIFIPCDVVSLVLQAVGGAMAATAAHNHDSADLGSDIMIAGLAFQVATMLGFITAASDFAVGTYRRYRAQGASALCRGRRARADAAHAAVQALPRRAVRLPRCSSCGGAPFVVAELSEGWTGPVMADQGMFVGFEGVLNCRRAVLALNLFHPWHLRQGAVDVGGGLKGAGACAGRRGLRQRTRGV
ncbi:hypothetical protein J3459_011054 [Metarhizium acridum]|nr:hypothetical protein J3459_011054 [Metarhizium acridum]